MQFTSHVLSLALGAFASPVHPADAAECLGPLCTPAVNIVVGDPLLSVTHALSSVGRVDNVLNCTPCENCGALVHLQDNNVHSNYEFWDDPGSGGNPPASPPAAGGGLTGGPEGAYIRLSAPCGGNATPYFIWKYHLGNYVYVGFIAMTCSEPC